MRTIPETTRMRKRRNEIPPSPHVYVTLMASFGMRTGCRCRKTLPNTRWSRVRGVSAKSCRKADFQSFECVMRQRNDFDSGMMSRGSHHAEAERQRGREAEKN